MIRAKIRGIFIYSKIQPIKTITPIIPIKHITNKLVPVKLHELNLSVTPVQLLVAYLVSSQYQRLERELQIITATSVLQDDIFPFTAGLTKSVLGILF